MKKVLIVRDFAAGPPPGVKGSLTVAYRRKDKLYLSNLDYPDRVTVRHDSEQQKVVIEVSLHENEYLAIGDDEGAAEKRTIEG